MTLLERQKAVAALKELERFDKNYQAHRNPNLPVDETQQNIRGELLAKAQVQPRVESTPTPSLLNQKVIAAEAKESEDPVKAKPLKGATLGLIESKTQGW